MKQFHVETKNQATGEWRLYERFKCRYQLGYVIRQYTAINEAEAELEAVCNAIKLANHVHRKRSMPGTGCVCFIETRIIEVLLHPLCGHIRKLLWQNGEFKKNPGCEQAGTG